MWRTQTNQHNRTKHSLKNQEFLSEDILGKWLNSHMQENKNYIIWLEEYAEAATLLVTTG